jgi:hypothetical protein
VTDPVVKFVARAATRTVFLTPTETVSVERAA